MGNSAMHLLEKSLLDGDRARSFSDKVEANSYIAKPFKSPELLAKAEKFVK